VDRLQKAQAKECLLFSWFIVLFHGFIMCLCCLRSLCDIFPTSMARYSLFVLKKLLLNPKQTNTDSNSRMTRVESSHGGVDWHFSACYFSDAVVELRLKFSLYRLVGHSNNVLLNNITHCEPLTCLVLHQLQNFSCCHILYFHVLCLFAMALSIFLVKCKL